MINKKVFIKLKRQIVYCIILFLFSPIVYGQHNGLAVRAIKQPGDSVLIYRVSISNFMDSIVVLPHSVFFSMDEVNSASMGLAQYSKEGPNIYYRLTYSWKDTLIDPQIYPTAVNFILPYQKLEFTISIMPTKKENILIVSYFSEYDLSYRNYLKTQDRNWSRNQNVKNIQIKLTN